MAHFTPNFFTHNRKRLTELLPKKGIVIVAGNGLVQRNADTTYPFRQDSNLYYLTGVTEPCAVLVIDMVHDTEWLMVPMRHGVHAIFDGAVDALQLAKTSGIADIVDETEGWKRLRSAKADIWYAPTKPKARIADMYTNPHRARVYAKAARLFGTPAIDIRSQIASLRSVKTEQELAAINQAVTITTASIADIQSHLADFSSEKQLEAELTKQFMVRGADGHAFQPIVASGAASCTLHYVHNGANIQKGEVLLFDVGAEVSNYAADISRTLVFGASPTQRQVDVIAAVKAAQAALIAWLKPGATWAELAQQADMLVAEQLVQLGLVSKNHTKNDVRQYFPHAVSHFLGLDVHDTGDYTQPLAEGMVITVEPGIYIQQESIGVRFENDVVITKNGAKKLGVSDESLL